MARFKGLFQFIGTLGGITAVQSKEGLYLKQANSIPKSRYQNAPEYADFRMNGRYMATASKLSKDFRAVMGLYCRGVSDTRMYSRLNAVMRNIILCDAVAEKGKFRAVNGIATTDGRAYLLDFQFTKNLDFHGVFRGKYVLDSTTGVLTLAGFNPQLHLSFPAGATHVGLQSGSMRFDFELHTGLFSASESVVLPLGSLPTDVRLAPVVPLGSNGSLLYFFKVYFLQEINGKLYPMKGEEGGAMKIIAIA